MTSSVLAVEVNTMRTRDGAFRADDARLNVQLGAWYKGKWESNMEPLVCISGLRWGTKGTSIKSQDLIVGQFASVNARRVDLVYESSVFREGYNKDYYYTGKISAGVQLLGLGRHPECTDCSHYKFHRWDRWSKGTTLNSRDLRVNDLCMFYIPFDRDLKFSSFVITDVLADGVSVPYIIKFNTQPALTRLGAKIHDPPRVIYHSGSITKEKKEFVKVKTMNEYYKNRY